MVKIIGIDLDDTLLNSKREINEFDKKMIQKASDLGIKIVLTSGRPLVKTTIDFYKKLDIYKEKEYFIGYNGGAIYEVVGEKEIFSDYLNSREIREIHSSIDKRFDKEVCHYIHLASFVKFDNMNQYVNIEKTHNGIDLVEFDFNDITEDEWCYKYMVAAEPKVIDKVYKTIPKDIMDKYNVVVSMPCFIEFQHKNVSKWQGLVKLASVLGVKEEEIMGIGDSGNDLSMIENSHYGVCMGNGMDYIKKKAWFVTDTNDNCGVGKAIEKVLKEYDQ